MNRWARRHDELLSRDLAEDEELLAAHRVEVRGSVANVMDGDRVHTRGSPRRRWIAATDVGFDLPGPIFVLGVSTQRLLFWKASPLLAHPVELDRSLPLREVSRVLVVRRVGRMSLAVLLEAGPLVVVRSLWGRGLRDLEHAFAHAREPR